jgi:hypothetical protein
VTRKNECLKIEHRLRQYLYTPSSDERALLDLIGLLRIERDDAIREAQALYKDAHEGCGSR